MGRFECQTKEQGRSKIGLVSAVQPRASLSVRRDAQTKSVFVSETFESSIARLWLRHHWDARIVIAPHPMSPPATAGQSGGSLRS
jgi:hypothetical protein